MLRAKGQTSVFNGQFYQAVLGMSQFFLARLANHTCLTIGTKQATHLDMFKRAIFVNMT